MAAFLYPVASFYFDHDEGTRSRDYKGCFIYLNISQIQCASYFKNHSFISKPINSSKVYIFLQKNNYQIAIKLTGSNVELYKGRMKITIKAKQLSKNYFSKSLKNSSRSFLLSEKKTRTGFGGRIANRGNLSKDSEQRLLVKKSWV